MELFFFFEVESHQFNVDEVITYCQGFVIKKFVISSYGFFTTKKRKIRKRITCHDNGVSSCSSWGKKQQTDPHGEDKKRKQHKL